MRTYGANCRAGGKWSLAVWALTAVVWTIGYTPTAGAAPVDWKTGGTSGNWDDTTLWNPAVVPDNTSDVNFNAVGQNGAELIYLNGNQAANSLTFRNTLTTGLLGGTASTPANDTLTLNAGITLNSGTGAVTIGDIAGSPTRKVDITLSGAQAFTNNAGTTLTVANGITNGTNLLTVGGSGNTTLLGILGGGSGGLTKTGAGTLTLSGVNSYTGATMVSAGTLKLGNNAGLGSVAGGTTVSSGAVLDMAGFTSAEAVTIAGSGIAGAGALINSGATASTLYGPVTLGAGGASIGGAQTLTLALPLDAGGSQTLTKVGAGTLNLRLPSSRTGATVIGAGSLGISQAAVLGTGTLTFAGGTLAAGANLSLANGTVPLTIPNPVTFSPTAGGAGTISATGDLVLSGQVTLGDPGSAVSRSLTVTNTGLTILSGGVVNGAGNLAGALVKAGTGALAMTGTNTYTGSTTISGGTLLINSDTTIPAASNVILGGGALGFWNAVPDQAVYGYIVPVAAPAPTLTTTRNYSLTATSTMDIGAGLAMTQSAGSVISSTGAFSLNKSGFGTLVLGGTNTHTGATAATINAGVLSVSSNANLGSVGTNGTVTFAGNGTTTPSALLVTGSFSTARALGTGANAGTIDVAAGATLTASGVISSTGSVTKAGQGTLLATNSANTLTSLRISGGGTYASTSVQPFATNATVAINGGALSLLQPAVPAADLLVATSGVINYGGGSYVRLQDSANFATQLSTTNTTTGLTRVNQGTLVIQAVNGDLGGTVTNGERLLASNISGVANTAVNVSGAGIVAPNIVRATDALGNVDFVSYGTSAQGFIAGTPGVGSSVASLGGGAPGAVATITTPQTLTGTNNSAFAVSTTKNISGGTLHILSYNNTIEGALLLNGAGGAAPVINSNVVFDPTQAYAAVPVSNYTTVASSGTVNLASTAGLSVGMAVVGPNIPVGAVINSIVPNVSFTMNTAAAVAGTASGAAALTALQAVQAITPLLGVNLTNLSTTAASNIVTVDSTTGLYPGMVVSAANMPGYGNNPTNQYILSGAVVTGITDATHFTISLNATVTQSGQSGISRTVSSLSLPGAVNAAATMTGAAYTINTNVITVNSTYGLVPGMTITGATIPGGSVVQSVTDATHFTISQNATGSQNSQILIGAPIAGATSGEGLVYVSGGYTGGTATISGNVTANGLTKFGPGNLLLSGAANEVLGTVTVQEGTLTLANQAAVAPSSYATNLVLNDTGTFDLNGKTLAFGSLANSANAAGGFVTNSGGTAGTLVVTGPASTTFAGQIIDGSGAGNTVALVKNGSGTLILGAQSAFFTNAGNNTFSGGVTLNQGTLTVNNPFGLGGGPVLAGQPVPLGTPGATYAITGDVNLVGGTLNLASNGGGIDGTIILGNPTTNGVNVNLRGPVTINVSNLTGATNTGNSFQINNFTLGENTLTMTGANNYRLRVAGTTNIAGGYANIVPNSATDANGIIEFAGAISGPGALNRFAGAAGVGIRQVVIDNPANSYSGGTNIVAGMLQVTANSGTPLGTGPVKVFPGAMLRLAGNGSLGGAPLQVLSRYNLMGAVILDNNFDPSTALTAANFSSAYGTGLGVGMPLFTQALNMATIGDGRAFLMNGLGQALEAAYIAPTLGAGAPDAVTALASQPVYRLSGGVLPSLGTATTLALAGPDNVLTNGGIATFVQVGSPLANVVNSGLLGQNGIVAIRNSNNYTGGTQVAKGNTVTLDAGGALNMTGVGGQTPLGTGPVEVYGTLQTGTQTTALNLGSFVAATTATTGANANLFVLRPGGTIIVNDVAAVTVAGGQGRWGDADALNLNGGTFRFNGVAAVNSAETIGTLTVAKGGTLTVVKSLTAALTVGGTIVRDGPTTAGVAGYSATTYNNGSAGGYAGAGTLSITTSAVNTLGNAAASYDRVIVSNGITGVPGGRGGTTNNGPSVTLGGMVAPWIIDATDNLFVGYNPMGGTDTGFQPILAQAAAPAVAGQLAVSKFQDSASANVNVMTLGVLGVETVNLQNGTTNTSSTLTLTENPDIYALRVAAPTNTTANSTTTVALAASGGFNSINIRSGGLMLVNSQPTAATSTNAIDIRPNLTFNNGVSNVEAVVYTVGAGNGSNLHVSNQVSGNITAAGLTKFGPGWLNLIGENNLTAPVTVNAGVLYLQNTLNGLGTAVLGPVNSQPIILNGGQLNVDASLGSASASTLADGFRRTLATLNSDIYVNGDAMIAGRTSVNADIANVLQHLKSLTFADLGANTGPTGGSYRDGVTLQLYSTYVNGTTRLGAHNNNIVVDLASAATGPANSVLGGKVTGGMLTKYGNGALLLADGTSNYSGGTVINAQGLNTTTSIVGSLTRTGTPFGTGSITINPGAMLRIADPGNITGNTVTLNSDGQGLGGIGLGGNFAPPVISVSASGTGGTVKVVSTGDYAGVLSLDVNNYTQALDLSSANLGGGMMFLGTSIASVTGSATNYFNRALTPGAPDTANTAPIVTGSTATTPVYRLGGGGTGGQLAIGGGAANNVAFENVLTGTANVQIGAGVTPNAAAQLSYINGNSGQVQLNARNNLNAGSMVFLNRDATLVVNNAFALGNATLVANQSSGGVGGLVLNAPISNPLAVAADQLILAPTSVANAFLGNVNLSPSGVGGTRTVVVSKPFDVGFEGVISGAPGSNLIKSGGTNSLILNGLNTYQGTTTIVTGGTSGIYAGTDVQPNQAGALGISDTPVMLQGGTLGLAGQITVGRDIIANGGIIRGLTLNTSVVTGAINIASGTLRLDQVQGAATYVGGVLDLQGPISGPGGMSIGSDSASPFSPVASATVRFSAQDANGFGTSTYSGGTNIRVARIQIAADTLYTGPASSPIVISGPLGTGGLTWGGQFGTLQASSTFEAYGADRLMVNALPTVAGGQTSPEIMTFNMGGHYNLTFTQDWVIYANGGGGERTKTFQIDLTQGAFTFSGDMVETQWLSASLNKTGTGTLVWSGVNDTVYTYATADTSYGSGMNIANGILRVGADTALGTYRTVIAGGSHLAGIADVQLRGGVLQVSNSFSSNRQFALTAQSGIDVYAGQTLSINQFTRGVFALNKTGAGTLAFNPPTPGSLANTISTLTIGGTPLATGAQLLGGSGGGTVSTTATGGTPFATAAVNINGGTLSLIGGTVAQALVIPTITYAGGSYISLDPGSTTTSLTDTNAGNNLRSGQGTLTLVGTSLANVGAGTGSQKLIVTNNAPAVASGILSTPSVYLRLAGSGQDADFATYVGGTGFQLNTAVQSANNLTGAQATSLGVVSAPTAVGTGSANSILDLRTTASITPTDGTSVLQILGGGLIFNGATASTVSSNLVFGTTATPLEALVYVRDGQTGTSTISGNFTATNFTKSGLATLLISGNGNVMAPIVAGLRVMQINEGTVQFANQAALPSGGQIIVSPMDTGTLDLAGQNLTIGGLGGNVAATAATGNVSNSGAAATLTVMPQNVATSIFSGLISGNVTLVKDGIGTLTLTQNNTYTGGTTIYAGNINSANGLYNASGTLTINDYNSLGSIGTGTGATPSPVTLGGGTLNITEPNAGADVVNNVLVTVLGPGNGYNVTVAGLNQFGSANTTSAISTSTGVANVQGINNLTFQSNAASNYALTIGGNAQGLQVDGTTTLAGNTVLNVNNTAGAGLFLAGQVAGTGYTISKIGAGALTLTNTQTGAGASSVAGWHVYQGTLEVRMSQGTASNPLGYGSLTSQTVMLDGAQFNVRHDGDNLGDMQVLSDFAKTDIQVGVTTPISSAAYTGSGNATLDLRTLSSANNKTVQFNRLVFGGALGTALLTQQGSNVAGANYSSEFVGGIVMQGRDAGLNVTANTASPAIMVNMTIDGTITGNGTLFRQGTGELDINTAATGNSASGGTVLTGLAGALTTGDTYFAGWQGTVRTLNSTAKLGVGDITIQPNARLFLTASSNLNAGQTVDVRSNLAQYAVVGIGDNSAFSSYNLRAPQAGGQFVNNMLTAPSTGAGVLALNSVYTQAIDLGKLGDGTWFLGSTQNGEGLNGTYVGGTGKALTPGATYSGTGAVIAGNASLPTYRLGGGTTAGSAQPTLYIGLYPGDTASAPNQLTGSANLVVGAPLTSGTTTNPLRATGTVVLNTAQNYTGATIVNVNSRLEFRGTMGATASTGTSGFDVFGQYDLVNFAPNLIAGGVGGTFLRGNGTTAIPLTMRPGAVVQLDNSFDLTSASGQGRWGDTTPVNLNGSIFRLVGSSAADVTETVGTVNVAGQGILKPQFIYQGRTTTINAASIVQTTNRAGNTYDNGSLSIEPTTAGQLGSNERVAITGATPSSMIQQVSSVSTGMVAPWMWNRLENQFLTYGEFGFTNAGFNAIQGAATLSANQGLGTDRLQITGAVVLNAGVQLTSYAARVDASITLGTAGDNTAKLILGSGGLIVNGAININSGIVAGSGSSELQIHNANTLTIGANANPATSGQISASNIVKDGAGTLVFDVSQQTFTGPIALNQGTILMNFRAGGNPGGNGGTIFMNGYNTTLNLRSDGASFSNGVYLAAGNPLANINVGQLAAGGQTEVLTGTLTFGGSPGDQGQSLVVTQSSNHLLRFGGTTNLGPAGNAIFNLGADTLLTGAVTGSGTLVKAGASNLYLAGANNIVGPANSFTGGVSILAGGLVAPGAAAAGGTPGSPANVTTNPLGSSNTITMAGGTLFLRADTANNATFEAAYYNTNNVVINGNATITVDRTGAMGAESSKLILVPSLTIGGQTLTVTAANTYRFGINNGTLTNMPTLNTTADMLVNGNLSDYGAGLGVIKTGAGSLWFANGNSSTFSGPLVINQGTLRFGDTNTASTTAQVGATRNIWINPGASVQLQAVGNVDVLGGQRIDVRSIGSSLTQVQLNTDFNPATVLSNSSSGVLLAGLNIATSLNMAAIGDGTFQLAATGAARNYSGATLGGGAAGALDATTGLYRLGGNGQDLNVTTTGALSDANTLGGSIAKNRLVVGSLALSGGTVRLGAEASAMVNNSYTGGTTVVRGSTLRVYPNSGTMSGLFDPMGTGAIDAFGQVQLVGNANGKFNTFNFHPGATIRLDNNGTTHSNDRWTDATPVAMDGSSFDFYAFAANTSTETVGQVTFSRGSRMNFANAGAGAVTVGAGAGTLNRFNSGTLVFTTNAAAQLGTTATAGSGRFIVTDGGPTVSNAMVPGYFVDGTSNTFVTYGANGFADVAFTQTIVSATTWPQNLSAGTDIVTVNAVSPTLADNPVIYALRLNNANLPNGSGQFNTVTFKEATNGDMGGLIVSTGNSAIGANLKFGSAGDKEGLIYIASGLSMTMNADFTAGGITKFGAGTLLIAKDQGDAARGPGNGLSNGWVVNEGILQANTLGALGNAVPLNTVTLNGSASGVAQLNLNVASGNTANQTFTSGKIIAVDNAAISWTPGANDRTQSIADVNVQSTGGTLLDAQLLITVPNLRSVLAAGVLSITGANFQGGTAANPGAIVNVNASGIAGLTSGTSSGFSVASLSGAADSRLTKWGSGVLYIRGDSSSTFAGTVSIEQGAIQIDHVGALGTPSAVTVKRYGTLDINAVGYAGAPNYLAGSIERWSADGARSGAGTVNLGAGTLQVANDQTSGTATIQLNGGSVEGYLNQDSNIYQGNTTQAAVYRSVSAGYSFQLVGNSFVGQSITQGLNGLDNGVMPTMAFSPTTAALTGVILEIKGNITEATPGQALTKQGNDTVVLSGTNSYSGGTFVNQGMLRMGATNAMPSAAPTAANLTANQLSTTGGGEFDLNGYNQTVGILTSPSQGLAASATFNAAGSGYITNTAPQISTLTTSGIATGLTATGATLTTSSPNVTLAAAVPGLAAGEVVSGVGIPDGTTVLSFLGTSVVLSQPATATAIACADLVFTPVNVYDGVIQYNVALTKTGVNVQQLNNTTTYVGATTVNGGVLRVAAGAGLSPASNLVLNGGVIEFMGGGTFSRTLGTGAGQVQFTPGTVAAISAFGAPLTVDLSGTLAGSAFTLGWGSASFNPTALVLNAATATAPLTFANSIDLNPIGAAATLPTRTFAVYNSSQVADAVTFNGNLSQGAAALSNAATIVKTGQGRLIFGAGSVLTYQGGTTVNDGILQLGNPNQLPSTTLLTVNSVASGPCVLSAGVLDMKGFSQSVGNLAGTGVDALVTSTGGAATLTFGSDATDQTYFGQINDGAGALDVVSLVKNGSGKSALWGNNDYSGTTIINGGTLLVDGTHTGGGAYTVTSGGTLGGTGTIDIGSNTVTIQSGGTLAPGNSPGILTINGDLTIDGTYAVDIGAFTNPNVLPTFDETILTGPAVLALGSTSVLDAFNWQGMWDDFSTGTWYPIIKYTSMSGTFGSWNGVYAIDYAYHPVVGENWVAIQVPEPAALTLLALSGAAMLLRGRRRRR